MKIMPTLQFPTSQTQFWNAMWAEQTLLIYFIQSTLRSVGGVGSICHYPGPRETVKYYNFGIQLAGKDDFHL